MQSLFLRYAAAPLIAGTIALVGITTLLLVVDAFSPDSLPKGFSSGQQLLGIDLLLVLVPSYLIFAWGFLHRRSWSLLGEVDKLGNCFAFQARLETPMPVLIAGGTTGVLYALLFNLPIDSVVDLVNDGALLIGLVLCMIFVWLCTGVVLSSRLYVSGVFQEAGRTVPVDPHDQASLDLFARSGTGDVLLAVGALVLTTVQSIDATFRYQNYLYALAVAVPATIALFLRPMVAIHARLRDHKRNELAAVNALISAAPRQLCQDDITALETLLQRRDRVLAISTWPIDTNMVSRLIIYGVIPPIAWVAAAVVQSLVEDLLAG